ncbi:hypothetical protein BLNAU_5134 [Blattamonas nauphoetae]|uniref:Uncharacterized protein n=1 Tax=Blattamonas nauphoetae TaxID=2049346 RepID=A0ABQ9Y849_9EUKA|nr:hypothetical protein BLNAU_5134 [Blattamonas nauphoetae]
MEEEQVSLKSTKNAYLNDPQESTSTIKPEEAPFLTFDANAEMSFQDRSSVYCSLVDLVKREYPFDNALQDKAGRFLKSLEPKWGQQDLATRLVTELVPSSTGSPSGFVESILTLLASPHSTVIAAALSFFKETRRVSIQLKYRLVELDVICKILATVQPHTPPILANETILYRLIALFECFLFFAHPGPLRRLNITAAADTFDRLEIVFRKVVIPSSQFVTFLISNRDIIKGDIFETFMILLSKLLQISPFYRPTMELVITSPIVMVFSTGLSSIEADKLIGDILITIKDTLYGWKAEDPEAVQSGRRIIQALYSEGFEDTLEQMLLTDDDGFFSTLCPIRVRCSYKCWEQMRNSQNCEISRDESKPPLLNDSILLSIVAPPLFEML